MLTPLVQPREEDLYFECDTSDDPMDVVINSLHMARYRASVVFVQCEATIEADAAIYDAICALERAEARS